MFIKLLNSRFRLRPSMVFLFTALALPFLALIVVVTYTTTTKEIVKTTEEMVERFNNQVVREVQYKFDPAISLTRSIATLAEHDIEFFKSDRSWPQLKTHLEHSPSMLSSYIGFEDKSIRAIYRGTAVTTLFNQAVPEDAQFAYIDFKRQAGKANFDMIFFKDDQQKEFGRFNSKNTYNPLARPWYKKALKERKSIIYGPIIDALTGHSELTFATPVIVNERVVAVAAMDISLDAIQEFLIGNRISKNAISLIVDENMNVVSSSESIHTNNKTIDEQISVNDLDSELPRRAFLSLPSNNFLGQFAFKSRDGETTYIASLSQVNLKVSVNWRVLSIAPTHDFLTAIIDNNRFIVGIGIFALVAQLFAIYLMSVRIARPLEQLAIQVDRIEQLQVLDEKPLPKSFFFEIDRLTHSIESMRKAISAFAAFVPVDLVRGLLNSNQKLELGGHSRFLTIMFCDLESFSTLSENSPSQQLLLRVSKYLEISTRCINEEMGTVDKFIGDGVMAFWGAPNTLEDHTYRACAAALKIQERMDVVNQEWESQGLPPLKVRIGIHSDVVLVGNIGSAERMSYTVMGDGVNIAARLEGANKELGTRICVSKAVVREAGEKLTLRRLDEITVKGRKSTIEVYELLGLQSEP